MGPDAVLSRDHLDVGRQASDLMADEGRGFRLQLIP